MQTLIVIEICIFVQKSSENACQLSSLQSSVNLSEVLQSIIIVKRPVNILLNLVAVCIGFLQFFPIGQ